MHISVATANFYYLPFQQALDLIAAAGFQYVKIDLYWQHGEWAMAQHLQDIPARQAVQVIRRAGLKVSSIHDGGGVIHDAHCTRGLINPELSAYLDEYAIWLNSPLLEKQMDSDWLVFLVTLPVPISLAVLIGSVASCYLIRKRRTIVGIIAGAVTSPAVILLLLLAAYFYVALQIQEMDRVMPHAPERDIYYEGWAMLLSAAVGFAILDCAVALGLTLSVSLAYLAYRSIISRDPRKLAHQDH